MMEQESAGSPINTNLVVKERVDKIIEIAKRNDAIAQLMRFKKYIPGANTKQTHENYWQAQGVPWYTPINWYFLEGVGRYNSFELRFHDTWEWLVSAIIEMKKYEPTHWKGRANGEGGSSIRIPGDDQLSQIFHKIRRTNPFDFDKETLWLLVSDYALALLEIKQQEEAAKRKLPNI